MRRRAGKLPREQQRPPQSQLPVGWARPDDPNLTDHVFAAAVCHLMEFAEAKRRKYAGGIDGDQVEVGFIGRGLVMLISQMR